MEKQEEWRPISGWEGLYEVCNLGFVRSVPRTQVRLGKNGKPTVYSYGYKLLRPGVKGTGHSHVVLSDVTNGRQRVAKVHRLVCEAFHGAQPGWDYEVAHLDHNPHNNDASNLRWVTHKENLRQSARLGRMQSGRPKVASNMSGVSGVSWAKHQRRWVASYCGTRLGSFKLFEDAVAARRRAEEADGEQRGVEGASAA